ncbi:MAG: hypothetical protein SWK90_07565 [Chloroflexota bacterium]|nr:hypothetical protein [Chloroflexota bacterium]
MVGGGDSEGVPISFDSWMLLLALSGYLLVRTVFSTSLGLGVLVPICMIYLALDGVARVRRLADHRHLIFRLKLALIFVAVLFLLLVPALEQIACRRAEGAHLCVHDGLIQTEEAVRLLLEGKNPYVEDYVGTPLEQAPFPRSPNPAVYHLAYLPLTFLVHLPPAFLSWRILGWYDGRMLYVALLLLSLPLSAALATREERRLGMVIALGMNLPLLTFTADGRNDILGMFWVLLSLYLALQNRRSFSMVAMGLGCATKQTIWFGLPFYFLYLLGDDISWRSLRRLVLHAWPFYLTVALIVGPFLLWDPRAFVDDVLSYLTGRSPTSYPLWGMGFGFLLRLFGLVGSETAYLPFWIPQLLIGGPVLCLLLVCQIRRNRLSTFWFGFAMLQLVLGYFSRIFQDNYLAMILSCLSFAFLLEIRDG